MKSSTKDKLNFTFVFEDNVEKEDVLIDENFNIKYFKTVFNNQKIFLSPEFARCNISNFGKSLIETKKIQKNNCKRVLKVYKILVKIIQYFTRKNILFDGKFYITSKDFHNSNLMALVSLLNLKFNTPFKERLERKLDYSCDYLDNEIKLNNICDFKNGKCRKYAEEIGVKASCCKANCPYGIPCKVKNISCKLFLCGTAKGLGYIFYAKYIPILKTFTFVELAMCENSLFIPLKKEVKIIIWARIIISILLLAIIIISVINIISILN